MTDEPQSPAPFADTERQAAELAAMRRMLAASHGTFSLSIAVCNSPALRDYVVQRISADHDGVATVSVPAETIDVYEYVREQTTSARLSILFAINLERSLPSSSEPGADSPVLRRLNGSRELWKQSYSCPVVFWVPEYIAAMLSTRARDLWTWRSHQFEFVAEPVEAPGQVTPSYGGDILAASNLNKDQKRFRIAELQQRIADAGTSPPGDLADHVFVWLNEIAFLFMSVGDLGEAERAQRMSLQIDEKLGRLQGVAGDYSNLGEIHRQRGDLGEAEKMFRKSLEIDEKLGHLKGMAIGYIGLGLIYHHRDELHDAEKMYRRALEIDEELGHLEGMASSYGNLGLIYRTRGDLSRAEKMLRKSLELDEKLGCLEGMARNYNNLGLMHYTRGDLSRAEKMLRKSLEIDEKLGRLEGMGKSYGGLGLLCKQRGEFRQARELWTKAGDLFQQIGMPHMVEKVQRWLDGLPGKEQN